MQIPTNAKKVPLRPLALGEKTGHHHSLMTLDEYPVEDKAEMFEVDGKLFAVRITGDAVALVHQEHKPHLVGRENGVFHRQGDVALIPMADPGEYRVVIQSEVTDWGARPVVD